MRVRFSCKLNDDSGKQKFAHRLAKQFKKMGVKIVNKNPDINLVFVKGIYPGSINILRLDNAWINSKINSKGKNNKISKVMKQCNAVIYQGEYSKKVCCKFIGVHKKYAVIPNGCDFKEFKQEYKQNKPYILTFSRWRPHKRLKETIQGFLESGVKDKYDLFVCGEPDYIVKDSSVKYLGKLNKPKLNSVIKGCEFVVHLAYMDCCPNSVVESLVCGKNVLYADSGGMKELVGGSGYGVNDHPFAYKLIELYNPPALALDQVVKGYTELINKESKPRQDLFISKISELYLSFFRQIAK